jgi:hypothetical protein
MTTNRAQSGVDPLKDLLGDVLARLEAIETQVGMKQKTSGFGLGSSSHHATPTTPGGSPSRRALEATQRPSMRAKATSQSIFDASVKAAGTFLFLFLDSTRLEYLLDM